MAIILDKNAFKLPRVDREKFLTLMRLGLDYNRDEGVFCFKNFNNIEKAIEAISDILKSEVVFLQTCTVCGKSFGCAHCKYNEQCTTKNLPFSCVCLQCLTSKSE